VLTRLEAHGFKNLLDFSVDLGPFNCLAGPNGVGKSNVFDAVRFLSLLTDHTIMEAALAVRGTDPETSNPLDLFWSDGRDRMNRLRLAAEMLVEPQVVDDFGRAARASSTYLRYEVSFGYEDPSRRGRPGRLELLSEDLRHFTREEAERRLRFPHDARKFRTNVVRIRRGSKQRFISTEEGNDGKTQILVHRNGSVGLPKAHAAAAPRTIIATSSTSETPTILAARREMQQWRLLALEPSAMRGADRFHSVPNVGTEGGHLPATLFRLVTEFEEAGGDPEQLYARVTSRLADLVPIQELRVAVDEARSLLTLEARESSGITLSSRSLSDGTLRFLALSIMCEDPAFRGLICMEEPENGIHPSKMEAMIRLLKDLPVDPFRAPGDDNPLRQVLVATHSPYFVQLQDGSDLLLATEARVRGPFDRPASTLRCRPLTDTWREDEKVRSVGLGTIVDYLTAPPEAQLTLDPDAFPAYREA
jgi:predicted ATPase